MHPDQWWAYAVGGVPLQSAAKSNMIVLRRRALPEGKKLRSVKTFGF